MASAAAAVAIAASIVVGYLYALQNAEIFESKEAQRPAPRLSVTGGMQQEVGGTEQLVLSNAWAESSGRFVVLHVRLKNAGTRPATIDDVLINGRSSPEYGSGARVLLGDAPLGQIPIEPGDQANLAIYIWEGDVISGQHLDVTVRTELGNEFPLHVVLP